MQSIKYDPKEWQKNSYNMMISGNCGKYNLTELDILWSLFKNTLELDFGSLHVTELWMLFFCMYLISKYPAVLNEGKRKNIFFLKPIIHSSVNPVLMLALIPVTFLPCLCSVHLFYRQVGLLFISLLLLAEMRLSKPFWEKVLKWMLSIKMAVLPYIMQLPKTGMR